MTADRFAELALLQPGAAEGAHMGVRDFRAGGSIFATLAHQQQGYGNLKFTPEQQAAFVEEWPQWFRPIAGGWGRMGMTHVVLDSVPENVVTEALKTCRRNLE